MKKIGAALLALMMLAPSLVLAATSPTVVGTPITFTTATPASTYTTGNLTVPATGSNQCLIVIITVGNGQPSNTTGVTWNGGSQAMSQIVAVNGTQTTGGDMWYLAAPTQGTNTVTVTRNVSSADIVISVFTLQDCAQTSPVDVSSADIAAASGTSASGSITTTVNNDLIINWFFAHGATNPVPNGSQTDIIHAISAVNSDLSDASSLPLATAGAQSTGASWTTSANYDMFITSIKCSTPCGATPVSNFGILTFFGWW